MTHDAKAATAEAVEILNHISDLPEARFLLLCYQPRDDTETGVSLAYYCSDFDFANYLYTLFESRPEFIRMCKPCHMALVIAENAERLKEYARQPRKPRNQPEEPKPVWHGLAEENYSDDFLRGM